MLHCNKIDHTGNDCNQKDLRENKKPDSRDTRFSMHVNEDDDEEDLWILDVDYPGI